MRPLLLSLLCLFLSLQAFANLEFRDHRYSEFRALPPSEKGDIVFIGNSITNMMNWNELFGNHSNIKNRGTSGALTKEILDNLESMIAGNPSKVFLMIGTNDLGRNGYEFTPETVAYRIEKILSQIRNEAPQAEVYYQSILPTLAGSRTREKTETTNSLVEEWINNQNDPKLTYIDLYSSFVGEDGILKKSGDSNLEDAYSLDGLHLTQKGYKVWADIIKDLVGYEAVLPDNASNLFGDFKGSVGMRVSYFGALPVTNNDILILGDAMIHGAEWPELTGSSDFKDRGIGWSLPGIGIEDLDSILLPVFKGNAENGLVKETPKAMCIYTGMANVKKGETTEAVVAKYKRLLSDLSTLLPNTPVFLMTLCPVSPQTPYREEIIGLNNEIQGMSEEFPNIFIVDVYEAFVDDKGNRIDNYFTGPNSNYLNGLGYAVMAQKLVDAVNKGIGTSFEAISSEEALKNINDFYRKSENVNHRSTVFDNSASTVPYRIPAIAVNKNGDVIAVADYRYSKTDIGVTKNGKLDLRYRIKDAETGEWGDVKTLAASLGEGDDNIAFGDPCIVADRESDLVLVTSCSGNVSFQKGTHDNHQGIARFYSTDGGKTWGEYEEFGNQILDLLDQRSDGQVNAFFIGSGKITQSSKVKVGDYYRLYCALLARVNDGKTKVNYVLYSDDFGKNWNILGDIEDCPIPYGADEPKAEELPDGSVLVSSRISGGRYYNIYHYDDINSASGKWGEMAVSNQDVNGIIASSNACNGETLCVPVIRNSDGLSTFLLFQSVPMNSDGKRANVGINFKELDSPDNYSSPSKIAADWDGVYEVSPYSSGYSTMVLDKDGDVAFFFEENAHNSGYDMIYRKLSVSDITNGKYSALRVLP